MSKYASRLRLSLEDAEEEFLDTTGEEAPEVEAVVSEELDIETVEATEEAAAETEEAAAVVEEGAEKVEELEDAAAGLESIHDLLAGAIEKGKIHRDTVTFANIAIESYAARVGYGDELNMSTESFQPRLALEGIKEWVVKAWEALKKFIRKLWSDIKIFFKSLFNFRKKLELRATRLKNAKASGKAKNDKIDAAGLVRMVSIAGRVQAPGGASDSIKNLLDAAREVFSENEKDFKEIQALAEDNRLSKAAKEADKKFNSFKLVNRYDDKIGLIGDPSFRVVGVQIPYVGYFGTVMTAGGKKYGSDDKSISTYTVREINEVGSMVLSELKNVEAISREADDFDRIVVAMSSKIEKSLEIGKDHQGKKIGENAQSVFNGLMRGMRIASLNAAKVSSHMTGHAMKVMMAYIKLAEKSLAQYNDSTNYKKY